MSKRVIKYLNHDTPAVPVLGFNPYSGAHKQQPTGPALSIVGAINTLTAVTPGSSLWLYNDTNQTQWVVFGDNTLVAPAWGVTTAIPVPSKVYFQISAGENTYILCSSASVGMYVAKDDTVLDIRS